MTCYKVVTAEFKWFGLQSRVENSILSTEERVFRIFHRYIIFNVRLLTFVLYVLLYI